MKDALCGQIFVAVIVTGLMGFDVSLGFILENVSNLGKTKLYVSTGTEFDHVVSLVNH